MERGGDGTPESIGPPNLRKAGKADKPLGYDLAVMSILQLSRKVNQKDLPPSDAVQRDSPML